MPDAATLAKASQALLARMPSLDAEELERLVRYHNAAYWERNDPEIDDPTFDKLVEALRVLRPGSRALEELGEGPAQPVGERRFAEVRHERPMLSLDKCYDDDTLQKWSDKINGGFFVTPKIDGVACSMRYDASGHLTLCATRGDGKVGDDITENASRIAEVPTELRTPVTGPVEVRGEVHMKLSRFRDLYAAQFANPRNLAAGALKQKDPDKSAEYGLSFFAYDLLGTDAISEREKSERLRRLGFQVPASEAIDDAGPLPDAFRRFEARRADFDYETDGVVIKADLVSEHDRLGLTAHHPRYAIAYKFQGEGAQTKLVSVEWSVGRSGVITPVAVVDPVFVSGVTVTRASLHNAGYLRKLGLRHGALVELVRRGGVIPHVERVLSASGDDITPPDACPSCGRGVKRDGDFVYCVDPDTCPDVIRGRVSHFTRVIDVLGFGKKHISALVDKGLVRSPADLYRLTVEQLCTLERMGPTLAHKLVKELNARRTLPLPVFLTALGIDEVGPTVAEAICEHYPSLDGLRQATEEDLAAIHGVGPSIASSLERGLLQLSAEIAALLEEVRITAPEAPRDTGHPLSGKSVVFTGKLALIDRKGAQKRVRDAGGKTPSGVSADLDYLVIGDEGSPLLGEGTKSSKHSAAEKLIATGAKIRILSESDFVKLLEG